MKPLDAPAPPEAEGKELADLVEEFAARTQAGEPLDPEDFVQAHPRHAEGLRRLLPAVRALTHLGRVASGPPDDLGGLPRQLGDFRIMREVGRGGMGIVYEAEQVSLGRRVALKVLPSAAALDGKHLQRFKNEAQAAALLQHPHIVPVIAVGEDQGAHFFAMQFIDGRSLGSLIADLRAQGRAGDPTVIVDTPPTAAASDSPRIATEAMAAGPLAGQTQTANETFLQSGTILPAPLAARDQGYFRAAARLLVQAARALEHAHQVGVIHRDVKPANFLVEARGHLWVTDFGLARLHNSPGLTATGDLLGTLRYMSPEQAQGGHGPIDHRTDIYSLGVSAYELLTLEHAFPGDDRQDLLRRIVNEEPPRPRRRNRALPADLEAIVLKAMEKDPADRYPTAQDLADDLDRFLEDRPILARRPSRSRAAVKWMRRHKGLVATTAAAVLVVLAVAVTLLTVSNRRLRDQEGETKAALRKAEEQEAKTQEALRKAEENAGRANRNARQALEVLNGLVTDLSQERITRDGNLARKVEAALSKAMEVYDNLAREADPDVEKDIAVGLFKVGEVFAYLGNDKGSGDALRRCLALFRKAAESQPQNWQRRWNLSSTYMSFAQVHRKAGRRQEAIDCLRHVQDCWEQPCLLESCPVLVSQARALLGEIAEETGNLPEAIDHYRAAIAQGPRLCAIMGEQGARAFLAFWHRSLGQLFQRAGRSEEGENYFRLAQRLAEELIRGAEDKNQLPGYQAFLGEIWCARAALREGTDPATARRFYEEALHVLSPLAAKMPGAIELRSLVADTHFRLGILAWAGGNKAEAAGQFRAARDRLAKLAAEVPGGGPGPGGPGWNENNYAWFLATCPDESFRDPRRAVQLAEKAVGRAPAKDTFRNTLGAARYRAGDAAGAVAALEESVKLQKGTDPIDWFLLALSHQRRGDPAKARECYDKGVARLAARKVASQELLLLRAEAAAAVGVRPDEKTGKDESGK